MKKTTIPKKYIENYTAEELNNIFATLEAEQIACCNWPEQFPYTPSASVKAFHNGEKLFLQFNVTEKDIHSVISENFGEVWTDPCVEIFIAPDAEGYYNFEMNCIATLLAAKRKSRKEGVEHFSAEKMAQTIRFSTLPHEAFDEKEGIHEWSVVLGIPFTLLGYAEGVRPEKLRANFYKCGDYTRIPHYVSWNPIEVPSPDFHRPEYFGELVLE